MGFYDESISAWYWIKRSLSECGYIYSDTECCNSVNKYSLSLGIYSFDVECNTLQLLNDFYQHTKLIPEEIYVYGRYRYLIFYSYSECEEEYNNVL